MSAFVNKMLEKLKVNPEYTSLMEFLRIEMNLQEISPDASRRLQSLRKANFCKDLAGNLKELFAWATFGSSDDEFVRESLFLSKKSTSSWLHALNTR